MLCLIPRCCRQAFRQARTDTDAGSAPAQVDVDWCFLVRTRIDDLKLEHGLALAHEFVESLGMQHRRAVRFDDNVAGLDARAGRGAVWFDLGDFHCGVNVVEDQFSDGAELSARTGRQRCIGGYRRRLVDFRAADLDTHRHIAAGARVAHCECEARPALVQDRAKTSTPVTGTPLAATITSPTSMPAVCAGLPGSTRITFMPVRLPTMIGSAEIPRDRDVAAGAVFVAGEVGGVGALVATDGTSLAGLLSVAAFKSIGTRAGFPVLMSSTSKFFKMPDRAS